MDLKGVGRIWTGFICPRIRISGGPVGSIKNVEFLGQLSDYQILKKRPRPGLG
jgi:hypothetical protein